MYLGLKWDLLHPSDPTATRFRRRWDPWLPKERRGSCGSSSSSFRPLTNFGRWDPPVALPLPVARRDPPLHRVCPRGLVIAGGTPDWLWLFGSPYPPYVDRRPRLCPRRW